MKSVHVLVNDCDVKQNLLGYLLDRDDVHRILDITLNPVHVLAASDVFKQKVTRLTVDNFRIDDTAVYHMYMRKQDFMGPFTQFIGDLIASGRVATWQWFDDPGNGNVSIPGDLHSVWRNPSLDTALIASGPVPFPL